MKREKGDSLTVFNCEVFFVLYVVLRKSTLLTAENRNIILLKKVIFGTQVILRDNYLKGKKDDLTSYEL